MAGFATVFWSLGLHLEAHVQLQRHAAVLDTACGVLTDDQETAAVAFRCHSVD